MDSVNDFHYEIQNITESDQHTEAEDVPKKIVEDNDLAKLVICAIHLSKLKDPRKLSCQHVFCYKCLKRLFAISSERICPICRNNESISDVNQLPQALLENQLLELIRKNRINNESSASINFSDEEIETIDTNKDNDINDAIIMEYMFTNAKYECVKNYSTRIFQNICQKIALNIEPEFSIFDICMIDDQSRALQIVLLHCKTNELIVISESSIRRFYIKIDNQIVKPEYIKHFMSTLILSGKLEKTNVSFSVFLQCNMNGDIIYQSQLIPWLDSSGISMMVGFDIDKEKGLYYLCMPQSNQVAIYNSSMIESDFYNVGDNQPEYVAICSKNNKLWISCSQNRRILILNRESVFYQTITTDPMIPKMIFSNSNGKIMLLDTFKNRIIWIYLDDKIYSQALELLHIRSEFVIKSFQILPSSQIIINTGREILMFQSTQCSSKWFRNWNLCSIL